MNYILARLEEPSTWRGIVHSVNALWVAISVYIKATPEVIALVAAGLMFVAGQIGLWTKDLKSPLGMVGQAVGDVVNPEVTESPNVSSTPSV